MIINARAVKKTLFAGGIDLVGIAGAPELLLAEPPRPALALMPAAKSVIVMAVAHSLGAVRAPDIKLWTRNKMQTSRILDQAAEKLGRLLERAGYLSLPVSADKPVEIHKRHPETGKKLPRSRTISHLSLKHAAVSAGLGCIGRSNLLLTERFGPHQRLCAVITEAPLEPDAPFEGQLCIEGCSRCEKACPVKALENGKYSVDPCFNYWNWGFDRMSPRRLREWPSFLGMLRRHMKRRDFLIEFGQTMITDVDNCMACMKACPVGSDWKKMGKLV